MPIDCFLEITDDFVVIEMKNLAFEQKFSIAPILEQQKKAPLQIPSTFLIIAPNLEQCSN